MLFLRKVRLFTSLQTSLSCTHLLVTVISPLLHLWSECFLVKLVKTSRATTSHLGAMPASQVKTGLPFLGLLITKASNASLSSGSDPLNMKLAAVTPDLEELSNYTPISNLPFLSKLLKLAVASQLKKHILQ